MSCWACICRRPIEDDNESFYSAKSATSSFDLSEPLDPQADAKLTFVPQADAGLAELRRLWDRARDQFLPDIAEDPILSPPGGDVDGLLRRFLQAERNQKAADPVRAAASRLEETARFRRDYRCVDMHRRGMARQLLMHASNPGASCYFGDCGIRDCDGEPVLLGRVSLMTDHKSPGRKGADKMIPCTHLRAAIFVCERAAAATTTQGSYILDLGNFPAAEMERYERRRFWDADGVVDDSRCIAERRAPRPAVGPHLPEHETMQDGLPVLKESLRMLTRYYPEMMKKVYFYRPGFIFRSVFRIFSLWVPADTREKFVMVNEGEEHLHFLAPGACRSEDLPPEVGGTGPPMDGDRFLQRAVEHYDATATLPAVE